MAFSKKNYILLAIGMAIVILGLVLMSGEGSAEGPESDRSRREGIGGAAGAEERAGRDPRGGEGWRVYEDSGCGQTGRLRA